MPVNPGDCLLQHLQQGSQDNRPIHTLGSNCPAKISSVEGAGVVISNSGSGAKIGFFKIIFSAIYIYYFISFIFEFCVLKFEFLRRTKYFIYNLLLFLRSSTMHMPFKF